MRVLSLFSGIGGLDLGLEWAGMTIVGMVEKDEFCRSVLDDGVPDRLEPSRVRALGNAVVPAVAEVIGRMVMTRWGSVT